MAHLIELLILSLIHLLCDLVDSTGTQDLWRNHNTERFVDQDVLSLTTTGTRDHMTTLTPSSRVNILASSIAQDPICHIASIDHNRRRLYHVTRSSRGPSCSVLIIVVCQLEVRGVAGSILVRDQLFDRYVLVGVHLYVLRRADYVAHLHTRVAGGTPAYGHTHLRVLVDQPRRLNHWLHSLLL